LKIEGASQISLPIRYDILSSVLIIDRKATIGLTLTQLADYAAMRTLTNSRAGGPDNDGTILGLFNSAVDRRAAEMTMFDREYLRSVYIGNGTVRSVLKIDQIASNILSNAER